MLVELLYQLLKWLKIVQDFHGVSKKWMLNLHEIMVNIYKASVEAAEEYGHPGNLVIGANIAGFLKVADAMMFQGLV